MRNKRSSIVAFIIAFICCAITTYLEKTADPAEINTALYEMKLVSFASVILYLIISR